MCVGLCTIVSAFSNRPIYIYHSLTGYSTEYITENTIDQLEYKYLQDTTKSTTITSKGPKQTNNHHSAPTSPNNNTVTKSQPKLQTQTFPKGKLCTMSHLTPTFLPRPSVHEVKPRLFHCLCSKCKSGACMF